MTITLSIKNVADELAQRLKERAARNHRSLQGELMAIIESVANPAPPAMIDEIYARVQASGLRTPRGESARIMRLDRDGVRR
jgi:plasmid stability protein